MKMSSSSLNVMQSGLAVVVSLLSLAISIAGGQKMMPLFWSLLVTWIVAVVLWLIVAIKAVIASKHGR